MIRNVLFDFGGVLAEEGFRQGLKEIAKKNGLEPDSFYTIADKMIYETGYLTGRAQEPDYWNALRERTGIRGSDRELREEILKRFVLRPNMIDCVDFLRSKKFIVALLSDQTNWLNEINEKQDLFRHFDRVFNSMQTHMSKRDTSTFRAVCDMLIAQPEQTVFIDDNKEHIERAAEAGLHTVHFTTFPDFEKQMLSLMGSIVHAVKRTNKKEF